MMAEGAPLHILYELNSVELGGMETHAADLAEGIAARGHRVSCALPRARFLDTLALRMEGHGIDTYRLSIQVPGNLGETGQAFRERVSLLRDLQPDVLHQHRTGPYHGKTGILAAWLVGVQAVAVSEHQPSYPLSGLARAANAWCDRHIDRFVVVSEHDRALQLRVTHRAPSRVITVHNGIDTERFMPAGPNELQATRQRLGVATDELLFGSVGRLDRQKGLGIALQAFHRALPSLPKAKYMMLGDGPDRASLSRLVEELGLHDHVGLLGYVKQPAPIIKALDVLIMPSRWESFGLAAAEAMAAERPVIASKVGGLQELVQENITGLLVEAGDVAGLAEAMVRLGSDAALRQRLGSQGRARIVERFSQDRMVDQMLALYEELMPRGARW